MWQAIFAAMAVYSYTFRLVMRQYTAHFFYKYALQAPCSPFQDSLWND